MASPADVGEVAAVRPDLSIPEQHVAVEAGEDVDYCCHAEGFMSAG